MKILGLIPARGGSKGIPGKNLAPLCGKPLIQWTIEAAQKSNLLTRCVLSSEDSEILQVASELGMETVARPFELATDDTPTHEVVSHAVRHLGLLWDAVLVLQPTNPLRNTDDIDAAISLSESNDGCGVLSVSPVGEFHPSRMYSWNHPNPTDQVHSFDRASAHLPRQSLKPLFIRDGSIYLHPFIRVMYHEPLYDGYCPLPIPRERSVRIDEPFDLEYAEFLLTRQAKMAHNTA